MSSQSGVWQWARSVPPASSEDEQCVLTGSFSTSTEWQCSPVTNFSHTASQPVGQLALLLQLVSQYTVRATITYKLLYFSMCNRSPWHTDVWFHLVSRLLKACGSRLTEKLLEGAPTEDTLVLIERQTGRLIVLIAYDAFYYCNIFIYKCVKAKE